jgi:hypothetical protein
MPTAPPANWTPDRLADWIEYQLMFSSEKTFSRSILRDFIEEDLGTTDLLSYDSADFSDDDDFDELTSQRAGRSAAAEGISEADQLSSDAFVVLEDRAAFVGDHYPFRVESDLITSAVSSWRDSIVYSFLLALNARFVYGLSRETNRPARIFERLVRAAMAAYVNGEAEHFGWPRDAAPGERNFAAALPALLRKLGERAAIKYEDIPAKIKDNEVDVFAWRPPGDDRRGQLIIMCQCAIGSGWNDKGIRIDKWDPFVTFAVTPVIASAFPFVPKALEEDPNFDYLYLSRSVGLWFDRLRLTVLLDESKLDEPLRAAIISYVEELIFPATGPAIRAAS